MLVRDRMTTHVFFVKEYATVMDAVALMKHHDIGFVPICSETGEIQGVLTDRDILLRCLVENEEHNLLDMPVQTIMTDNPVCTEPDTDIHQAALLFSKHKVHRLPVLRGKYLVGILSLSDLACKRVFLAEVGDILNAITS